MTGNISPPVLRIAHLADGLDALHLFHRPWRSWTDCYVLRGRAGVTLVDSGLAVQRDLLVGALAELGIQAGDVSDVLLTHGHPDHAGNLTPFPAARVHCHEGDLPLLAATGDLPAVLSPLVGRTGEVACGGMRLEYQLAGTHTPGSVVFWLPRSEALFCGDLLPWFNEPLPAAGTTLALPEGGARLVRFVRWWTATPGFANLPAFPAALAGVASRWQPALLCSGHGPVVRGAIAPFLQELAQSIQLR